MAGLRPLVSRGDARNTKQIIRDHEVEVDRDSGLISVLGGKWTTYRAMAEDAVNVVQQILEGRRFTLQDAAFPVNRLRGVRTDFLAHLGSGIPHLAGYRPTPQRKIRQPTRSKFSNPGASQQQARGALSWQVAPSIQAEIVYSIRCEMAASIEDILARRIGLQWFSWNSAIAAAPLVGSYLAREFGWPAEKTQQAVREYTLKLQRTMRMAGLKPEQVLPG